MSSIQSLRVEEDAETHVKETEQEWRAGFEAMGRDPEMDVEYMLHAANEADAAIHGASPRRKPPSEKNG
jgi:hypothetical protein